MVKDIPYAPSTDDRLKIMVELSEVAPGKKTIDLGAGNGKVVVAMAKLGAVATGVEIDPILLSEARQRVEKEHVWGNARIIEQNIWKTNLAEYDIVTVYGITSVMPRLEIKLKRELKPGARVVSNYFNFPTWQPAKKKGEVLLYIQS